MEKCFHKYPQNEKQWKIMWCHFFVQVGCGIDQHFTVYVWKRSENKFVRYIVCEKYTDLWDMHHIGTKSHAKYIFIYIERWLILSW